MRKVFELGIMPGIVPAPNQGPVRFRPVVTVRGYLDAVFRIRLDVLGEFQNTFIRQGQARANVTFFRFIIFPQDLMTIDTAVGQEKIPDRLKILHRIH
jgi:hypothetical protein